MLGYEKNTESKRNVGVQTKKCESKMRIVEFIAFDVPAWAYLQFYGYID